MPLRRVRLMHVAPTHKAYREIVLGAVKQNEDAVRFVSPQHKVDREIVLEAAKPN